MLLLALIILVVVLATSSSENRSTVSFVYNPVKLIVLSLILSIVLIISAISSCPLDLTVSLFSGLYQTSYVTLAFDLLLFVSSALVLTSWPQFKSNKYLSHFNNFKMNDYSLIVLFSIIGGSFLLASNDLISLYLALELQSFGVYVLTTLYRDSESATSGGMKYFFLGALSSALILLGSAILYTYLGLTQFESIYILASVPTNTIDQIGLNFGLLLILIGLLFKVAAAPFHSYAPDVYDGAPTQVTIWLTTIPKLSLFGLLLVLQPLGTLLSSSVELFNLVPWTDLLLLSTLLSFIVGSVIGLGQYRIKRLLAYSTIGHVGFILLGLASHSTQSLESTFFYLGQYTFTTINVFLILIAFGIAINGKKSNTNYDIQFIKDLTGQFLHNPALSLSLSLCLFSMAGVPPLLGFFGKQVILQASLYSGYNWLALVGIVTSVISAYYYLKIVRTLFFESNNSVDNYNDNIVEINSVHSFTISLLTISLLVYIINPSLVLNSMHLLGLNMNSLTLLFIVVPVLIGVLLLLNLLLAVHKPDAEKVTPYECGFSPVEGQTRTPFTIQYYLVGILFLVFDLEILLFFPLSVSLYQVSSYGFTIAVLFFSVLTIGFIYELSRNVLHFTDQRSAFASAVRR
ncbi:hypothetical protein E3P92_03964 [Wallemia ichthyophaga]|uniref:NADH-ubiquinone oxidoreductase chain 2 n=1 Tax=Wallemia ichthyophaga TaxID=245174 RepID=A0A4T0E3H3_WALIC|nr:hypothetical protein E3P91_04123 [Wallemia ichthyophaga]TIA78492.1 hypothetical protein E3P98_03810 [Wallemia ichthyophaga]TIA87420.1 hypothetical protein E3P97_03960 [Wallemia ichthyophaga]TIA95171.1 hypothetical protein E3P95_03840 [Wallemia ichthyophaga]TIA96074.1 hypothetical protein E3P94_03836 [Wallemia ichthyophaga]